MGSRARARRTAAALGVTGLLFAVLGAVMIVVLPWIIKQQVIKVCGGRRPGPASAADAWATRSRVQSPAPGPLSTEERASGGPTGHLPSTRSIQAEVGGMGENLAVLL